ncbi:MAG: alpha/beta fold hydrolase, partial [Verrucomicrobiae bacterium]|nr:alpha/beta fold hydrolase [Verrucomicrobiae bacterium]NNJ85604.1 alpha/beta fold hydrolase [Akkermansiaceae bacterium]
MMKNSNPINFLKLTAAMLMSVAMPSVAAEVDVIQPADSLPATTPWALKSLSQPPAFEWAEGDEVRSLFFEGETYQGKPTRVFAYYATPGTLAGDPSKDKNLPAIVLVHGGGGRAFPHWAKLWASRGYAAIAMDLSGKGANNKRLPDGGPSQKDQVKFGSMDQPVTDQWTYHSVANVILAHSLIRSFPEVDPKRTAITGISWGGYLTCIVAGLDDRFKAAVPVYGCGFLHENSKWLGWFKKMTQDHRSKWIQLWDPSMYVGSAAMPMLFVNGGLDFAYPPDSHAKTYALVQSEKNLHFVPNLRHGHVFDRPKAVEVFIDHHLKQEATLAKVTSVKTEATQITAEVKSPEPLVKAQLYYTTGSLASGAKDRKWMSLPAAIDEFTIKAPLPPDDST